MPSLRVARMPIVSQVTAQQFHVAAHRFDFMIHFDPQLPNLMGHLSPQLPYLTSHQPEFPFQISFGGGEVSFGRESAPVIASAMASAAPAA
jgi:hypothetical protein